MEIFEYMTKHGHEQVMMCSDPPSGLKAIIAIHNTTLGPACGGTRIRAYQTEEKAVTDVLRLSEAMTYKAAAAGLPLGGGKGVIIADPNTQKTDDLLRAYGKFVDHLNGKYITTTDVGVTTEDMNIIRQTTKHVVGLPLENGGSGDTSIMTAYGIYRGMRACAHEKLGVESLDGRSVIIQGFGKVGSQLAQILKMDHANVMVTDAFKNALDKAKKMGFHTFGHYDEIYDVNCQIFSPCAMGGGINKDTIPRLQCKIVAGGANNQLLEDEDVERLHDRDILYAPDYIINAGGIINIMSEIEGKYNEIIAKEKTSQIYDTMIKVINMSKSEGVPTARAADMLVKQRLNEAS